MNLNVNGGETGNGQCFAHARMHSVGFGLDIYLLVMRSGEIHKRSPRTNAVEDGRHG